MTPTAFDFTVTMPGDSRLVGAVRQLAVHAAGYAQLPPDASEDLAAAVQRAAEAAIASTQVQDAAIELSFAGDDTAVSVRISCDAAASAERPRSTAADGVSVEWSSDGMRQTCHIRQRIPA